jgi:hypothetical protein
MNTMERDYNTTRNNMKIREYGRNVQNLVDYALSIEDKNKRTKLAYIIVSVMQQVNPTDNINDEYYKKLWNHIYAISDYKLDVEYPYEVHKLDELFAAPSKIEYKENKIRFRFYGLNTELVLKDLAENEPGEERDKLLLIMANQMKEMYINWNKNIVADDVIGEHIQKITDGRLKLPEGVELISSNIILKKLQSALASVKPTAKPKQGKGKKFIPKDKKFVKKRR